VTDLDAIERRYSAALDARPSKGVQIGDKAWTALTDSVADIPDLITALRSARRSVQKARRSRYCGCAWCCASTPPEQRGETHQRTCQPKPGASL
jgi:hypothetical protein